MYHDHHETLDGPHFDAGWLAPNGRPARLHKGGRGAQPPKVNKKMEQMQMKLLQAQLRQAGQKIEMPHIEVPPPPKPPPPPPTSSSVDVQEAATEARRQALRRSGYRSTLFAGETGGSRMLGGARPIVGDV
jgi:hypothetical protein